MMATKKSYEKEKKWRHRSYVRERGKKLDSSAKPSVKDSDVDSLELKIKRFLNRIGVVYIILTLLFGMTVGMCFIIPALVKELNFIEWKHRLFAVFSFCNVLGNIYLVYRHTDTSYNTDATKETKHRCLKSQVPFRAHFCRLCKVLVLKRDHHCFFLGKCIGYYNQKYFVWCCGHLAIGSFYALIQTALYLSVIHNVEFPGAWTYIVLLPRAVIGWLSGETDIFVLILIVFIYMCLFGGLIALGFFLWEICLAAAGMTSREALYGQKKKLKHPTTLLENWKDVFGRYWFLGMICPIPLPQHGNGLYTVAEN